MFIQIGETPNPNTLKFMPGMPINNGKVSEFADSVAAEGSSLATALFKIEYVKSVFFGGDFVSVTKSDDIEWDVLKPEILTVIMEFLTLNSDNATESFDQEELEEFFDEKDIEMVGKIKELIDNYVKPAVIQDGGDIKFKGYSNGIVFVKLRGACSGCPSASITLKEGIYNMLSYYIPDIQGVESIQ
ncbi:NifU family protein [Ehrlichia chaffeensis str. Heartland]|uniref:NifU domain protein n=1 Tax=Ehrlichia chaffeensis (strain ATCC CRL-10679 / Arkansas) TaxID=205920 RepID=Q2GHQ7_EHRCR|nr:NifU family protein [Ehrlichia chaffeensis]ABD45419.1 NifU domain protein [Ehrlichia chaffeensis str. Arkansas]AHX03339.1 NifU family protein [Ehrlichia chaffeensis str. Heartland]AHX07641.1 NifU family protein [Ehrlichia chaffeensis str. Osceola]AHX08354.1 NifU family protein [Ehrlichia chaffeensis str. Saint Vincent]AHX09640.1 NifU family protein [Ehrlichia chaffeensis str. Wakulla]